MEENSEHSSKAIINLFRRVSSLHQMAYTVLRSETSKLYKGKNQANQEKE